MSVRYRSMYIVTFSILVAIGIFFLFLSQAITQGKADGCGYDDGPCCWIKEGDSYKPSCDSNLTCQWNAVKQTNVCVSTSPAVLVSPTGAAGTNYKLSPTPTPAITSAPVSKSGYDLYVCTGKRCNTAVTTENQLRSCFKQQELCFTSLEKCLASCN